MKSYVTLVLALLLASTAGGEPGGGSAGCG